MSKQIPYEPPRLRKQAFNCPFCNAYARMHWGEARAKWPNGNSSEVETAIFSNCDRCDKYAFWLSGKMIYPVDIPVEGPNEDLPESVIIDYNEAAQIVSQSPRGAAALMRLAIQKLVDELVEGGDDLNTKIGKLVKEGLDKRVQMSLDAVRVIGNEAVHPGQIDFNDSPETAHQLFKLVNLIGRRMITEPAEVEEIYTSLPVEKRKSIEDRDTK